MNKRFLPYCAFLLLALFLLPLPEAKAQFCAGDTPLSYTVVPNPADPSECFLQINWGSEMPEILCGTPGSPAPGSTLAPGQRIEFLYATIGGVEYPLYERTACLAGTNTLMYGPEANTYVTGLGEIDFCLADAERSIGIEGVRLGADVFNCQLLNSRGALPVEFLYFKGAKAGQANVLEWATASEENTAVFVVEKSPDGKRFIETVGTREAKGFSHATERYQLRDEQPSPLNYYRVRAIDFDGSEMASEWVVLHRGKATADKVIQVSPIPLGQEPLQVYYEAKTDEALILTISDINGRKLWEERKELEAGIYHWNLDFPDFQQSLLIFRLHSRDGMVWRLIPCENGN